MNVSTSQNTNVSQAVKRIVEILYPHISTIHVEKTANFLLKSPPPVAHMQEDLARLRKDPDCPLSPEESSQRDELLLLFPQYIDYIKDRESKPAPTVATPDAIEDAYRTLALKIHPDCPEDHVTAEIANLKTYKPSLQMFDTLIKLEDISNSASRQPDETLKNAYITIKNHFYPESSTETGPPAPVDPVESAYRVLALHIHSECPEQHVIDEIDYLKSVRIPLLTLTSLIRNPISEEHKQACMIIRDHLYSKKDRESAEEKILVSNPIFEFISSVFGV